MSAAAAPASAWVRLDRVERWWTVSPVPALVIGGWVVIVGVMHYVGQLWGQPIVLCAMKRTTGVPCPGCRGTRAAFALGRGELIEALMFNPLAAVFLVGFTGWLILRFGFGRRVRLNVGRRAHRAMGVALTLLILLNWAYVIYAGG